jgi:hypothetical protein
MKSKLLARLAPLYGFLVAAAGGAVTYVNTTCPDLIPSLGPIALGSIVAGFAIYKARPEKAPGLKSAALGIATCVGTVLFAKLSSTCPDMMAAGGALWSKSPQQLAAGGK